MDILLRIVVRRESGISVKQLATGAQIGQVMTLDVFHFQVRAGGVGRKEPASISLLIFVLLIEEKHLEHVLSVDQLVLQLLILQELGVKERPLNVDVMLDLIQLFLLEVKGSFFFKDFLALSLQLLTRLLNLFSHRLKLDLLLLKTQLVIFKSLPVSLDKLTLLL